MKFSTNRLILLIAVILFVAAAFGVSVDRVSFGRAGLAFFAAAGLV